MFKDLILVNHNDVQGAVASLKLKFPLFGSRYFNAQDPFLVPISPSTDYDFFAEDTEENFMVASKILEDNGCSVDHTGPHYNNATTDSSTTRIISAVHGQINIIFKHPDKWPMFCQVMTSISPSFYATYIRKSESNSRVDIGNRISLLEDFVKDNRKGN